VEFASTHKQQKSFYAVIIIYILLCLSKVCFSACYVSSQHPVYSPRTTRTWDLFNMLKQLLGYKTAQYGYLLRRHRLFSLIDIVSSFDLASFFFSRRSLQTQKLGQLEIERKNDDMLSFFSKTEVIFFSGFK